MLFVLQRVSFLLRMPFLDNNDEVQLEWNRKGKVQGCFPSVGGLSG